jgi:exodeoxyribonuclease VII small subunit
MTSKTSFESLIKKLETIVDDLEEGDLPLEKALRRYEEGMKLSRQCNEILDASKSALRSSPKQKRVRSAKRPLTRWMSYERPLRRNNRCGPRRLSAGSLPDGKTYPVDESLCNYLQQQENKVPDRLLQAMSYSLMAGGKRLRPILCLAACEAVRGDDAPAMATGCALEMIHTYSLIHDDLPAMDNDALRRGKPTCHVRYDEATAILAGDALLTLAFEVLAADMQTGNRPPCPAGGSIIHLVARAAGPGGMIGGQVLDILSEGDPMSTDALENLHRLKTGEMIVAAVKTGAMIGAASDEQLGGHGTVCTENWTGIPGHGRHSQCGRRSIPDGKKHRYRRCARQKHLPRPDGSRGVPGFRPGAGDPCLRSTATPGAQPPLHCRPWPPIS